MRKIAGKKALVTGAADGIGRAIAVQLAKKGVDVFLVDIQEAPLKKLAIDLQTCGVQIQAAVVDLASTKEVDRCADLVLGRWGELDILVNNAGIAYYGLTLNMTDEQWEKLWAINFNAPVRLTRRLLPTLLAKPEAHVLNVASILGICPANRLNAYCTSKSALIGFSESLRLEFGRQGLGVTAFCPGFVKTSLFESSLNGHHRETPTPPSIICANVNSVAKTAVKSIVRNKRLAVVTPMGRSLHFMKWMVPGLMDRVYQLGRRKAIRKKTKMIAEGKTIAPVSPTISIPISQANQVREVTTPDEAKIRKAA